MAAYKKLFKEQWKKTKTKIKEHAKKEILLVDQNDDQESNDFEQES